MYRPKAALRARQHSQVQKDLEKLIQINSNFSAGYILLCKAAFGVQDWDAVNNCASWLISVCPQYYDAHIYLALESLFSEQSNQFDQECVRFILFQSSIRKTDVILHPLM